MKLRIRRSGRKQGADQQEHAEAPEFVVKKVSALAMVNLAEDGTPLNMHGDRMIEVAPGEWEDPLVVEVLRHYVGRCHGVTYRGKPCTLDAGPDGYCVFHKPGATA